MALTLEFIERLPKTDLHCHLDGSLRIPTILDLAEKQGVRLPADDPDKLFKLIYAGDVCNSLEEYLKAFDITLSVMQNEEALYRCAYELVEDCAREGVRYLEVRYSPMLHTRQGLKLTAIVEAVIQGLRAGERKFGIRAGVLLCGIRSVSAESSLRMAELCVAYKNRGVVGFDLAGAELQPPRQGAQAGVSADPRQQRQLHRPRWRGLWSRLDRPGHPLLRRPPHRPRHPPARKRRPAQLPV